MYGVHQMVSKFYIIFMRDITVPSLWGSLLCSLKKGHGVMEFIYFEGYYCPLNDEDINMGSSCPKKEACGVVYSLIDLAHTALSR